MPAVVAIVGRPNVGKSTLFNRLIGKRKAIESDIPGTTRDRLYGTVEMGDYRFFLVDTGGLELDVADESMESSVQEQSITAINGASVIIFMVDIREELTSEDFHAADLLRRSHKPVILVANKCDNPNLEEQKFNLYELGFGDPVAITALHSYGVDALESRILGSLKALNVEKIQEPSANRSGRIALSILGRPNVGKSTLVNALFGKKRVVTSDIPGTTRDATEIPFEYDGKNFTLIDTAGIRRKGSIEPGLEKFSILRSMQAISDADVCVLLMDFEEGSTNQDAHNAQYILEEQKGLILVVNKTDLLEGKEREDAEHNWIHQLQKDFAFVPWVPVVFTSALGRKNIFPILDLAIEIAEEQKKVIPEQDLTIWLDSVLKKQPPTGARGKHRFSISSVVQDGIRPPTFVFRCQWPEIMHFSYKRYLENELRAQFGFRGAALRLIFRKSGDRGSHRTRY